MDDQDLTISLTCADADDGHLHQLTYLPCQCSGYLLQHDGEAAHLAEQLGIAKQLLGLCLFLSTDGISAELVDALRRKAKMSHYGNASIEDGTYGFLYFYASLQFEGIATALLHDADGILHAFRRIDLIGTEGHVANDKGTLHTTHHAAGMVNHLVERNGQRCHVAGHHVAGAVANEHDVNASPIHKLSHGIIIRCEHGYLLPLLLHFYKTVSRHLACIAY